MKITLWAMILAIGLALSGSNSCLAQSAEEQPAEASEQEAAKQEAQAEEEAARLEKWAEAHQQEIEEWAEAYGQKWEKWAEQFEEKWQAWAEDQEKVWEDWAESYSHKWEEWGKQLESGELDEQQLGQLLERNLEMLGEMPLGEMLEGALEEGMADLKDAPWEGLGELQEMIRGSLEQSLKGMEEMKAENDQDREKLAKRAGEMKKALSNLQSGLEAKQSKLEQEAKTKLDVLRKRLESGELDDSETGPQIQMLMKALQEIEQNRGKVKEKILAAKERAEAAEKEGADEAFSNWAKALKEEELQAKQVREELKKVEASKRKSPGEKKQENAKDVESKLKRLYKSLGTGEAADGKLNEEILKSFLAELAKERDTIESKESELASLRQEIKGLRDEIQKMKKDREK